MPDSNPPVIGDLLASGFRLAIDCGAYGCSHRVFWTPQAAVQRLGPFTTYPQAQARLFCAVCRADGYGRPGDAVHVRPAIEDIYAAFRRDGHMG